MRLVRVRLRNFRCYQEEISIDFNELTMIAGRNDAGKSTIFDALAAFFEEAKLDQDDACNTGSATDVRIICEFEDYPDQLVLDAGYPTSLSNEYLLNPSQKLELHQIWNCTLKTPKSSMFALANHPADEGASDLLTLTNANLKKRAKEIGADLASVDQKINAQIREAIWKSFPSLTLHETLIPLEKETGKKIWSQLKGVLPTYALFKADRSSSDADPEAQDPMKAAIKEAFKAMEGTLAKVIEKIEEQVQDTADLTLEKLKEMHPELASQLTPRFTAPNWNNVLKVSLTGDEDIPINKRGSGVRRLILLNFFRAKAEKAANDRGESTPVIYAIEEPETSQHPANQKLLMKAFMELAASSGCQVLLTTHNPVLARRVPIGCIRYICEENDCKVVHDGNAQTMQMISNDLGVLPDRTVRLFIGVEGINDINFLLNISSVLLNHGVDVPDLSKLEDEGQIVFIPCGGSNLALWTSRFAKLNIPEFHLFDGDKPENQGAIDVVNTRDNCTGLLTSKLEMENYIHPDAIVQVRPELVGLSFGDRDDVPKIVAEAVHITSGSTVSWDDLSDKKRKKKMSKAKLWLNNEAVLRMSPDLLKQQDQTDDVMNWFSIINTYLQQAE